MNVDQLQQLALSAAQEVALAEKGVHACRSHATKLKQECDAQARATQEQIGALRQRLQELQTEATAQAAEHKKLREAQTAKLSKAEQLVADRQRALHDIRQKLKDAKKMAERAAAAKAAKARAQAAIASAQASSKVARRTTKVALHSSDPVAPSPEDTLATIEFTYCYNSKGKLTSPEPMTFRLRRKHSQGTVFHVGRAGGGLVDDESSWLELEHNPGMSGNHLELYLATNRNRNASDPFAIKVTHHGTNDTVLCNHPSKKGEKMRKKHPYDLKTGAELTINDNSVITITAVHFADPADTEGSENSLLADADHTAAAASVVSAGGNTVEAILRLLQVGGSTLNRRRYTFVFTQGPGDPVVPLVVGSGADKAAVLASLRPSSAALSDVELMTVLGDDNVPTCLLELQLRADTDDGHNGGTPSGIFVRAATPQAEGLAHLRGEPLAAAWREVEANDVLAVSQDSVYQVLSVELSVASDDASATAESNAPQSTRVRDGKARLKPQLDAVPSHGKGVLRKKGTPAPGGEISEKPATLPQPAANTTGTDEYDWEGTAATVQAAGEMHSNLQSPVAGGSSSLSSSVAVSEAEIASANMELGDMFSGMGMDVAATDAKSAHSGDDRTSGNFVGAFTSFSSTSTSTEAVSLAPTEVPSRFGADSVPTSSRSPRAGEKRKAPLVDTSMATYDVGTSPGSGRNSGAVTPNALRRGTMRLVTDRNERVELSRQKRRCGVRASPTFFKRGRYRDDDSGSGSEASYRRAKGTPSPVVARVAKNWKADYDSADEGEEEFERRRGSATNTRKMGGAGRAKGHGVGQLRDEVPSAAGTGGNAAPPRAKTAAVLKLNPAVQHTITTTTTTTSPRTGTVCKFTSPKLPTPSQDVRHPIARRGGFGDRDLAASTSQVAPEAQQGARSPLLQEGRPLPISRAARVSLAIQQSPSDPLVFEKAGGARVKDEAPAQPAGCKLEILLRLPRPKRGKRKSGKKGASATGNEAEVYRIELDSSKSNTRACVLGRVLHGHAGQLQDREERRRMEFSASSVSGTHAELFLSRTGSGPADFGVCVRDCDSTNGTFHNNRRLQFTAAGDGEPLREGDRLVLGAKSTGLALRVASIRPVEVIAAPEKAASKDEVMAGARKRSKRAVEGATPTPRASQPASPQQGTDSPAVTSSTTNTQPSPSLLGQGEASPAVARNSSTTVLPSAQELPTAPEEGRKVILLMKFDSPEIRSIKAKVEALGNVKVLENDTDLDFCTVTHVVWKSRAHGLLKALVAGCKIVYGMEWIDACAKANRWLPLKVSFDQASILRPGAPEEEREYCCVRSASNPFDNRLWAVTSPLVQVASSKVLKIVRFFAHLCQSKELPIVDKRTLPSGEVEYISTGECLSGGRCSADRGTVLHPNFVIDHVLTQAYSRNNLPPCLVLSAEGMLEFLLGKKPRASTTTAASSASSSPTSGLQSTYEIARAQNIQGNEAELRRICQSN